MVVRIQAERQEQRKGVYLSLPSACAALVRARCVVESHDADTTQYPRPLFFDLSACLPYTPIILPYKH